ncbi:MAG: CpsD/CapB family tyrosine-protein kinase [Clostridia bacterium]|nr:CpsD/CapB family tyrosine-protein kinase [Clostridia bacterium]
MKTAKNKGRVINTVDSTTNFQITEAYKALRTNVQFSVAGSESKCKRIAITSALPKEGKTITTINLAVTFAQTDARVLIIDCDMRRPRIHRYYDLESRVGLSNILSGMCTLTEAIKQTNRPNLHVIPAGLIPPNPAELIASENMKKMLDELSEVYDYIIIDTPPVNIVTDALSLVPYVDGTIIVVRSAQSTHPETKKVLTKFEYANAPVLGFVLNNVISSSTKGYTSKYRNYSYR